MKYTAMIREKTWNAPSAAEEKILALEAKLNTFQKQKKRTSNNNQENSSYGNPRPSQGSQGKQGKQEKKGKPEWMTKKPNAADLNKPKRVNDKEYWWCPNHKCFTRHKASDCRGVGVGQNRTTPSQATQGNNGQNGAQLRLANALSAVVEEE